MSHPNPSHDRENEYKTDFKTSVHKEVASKMPKKMTQRQLRDSHGIKTLSKKESAEKTKNWPLYKGQLETPEQINKFLGE
jgi:pyruvoyl-dependent arginine decarboxylase (PvlArgDC)